VGVKNMMTARDLPDSSIAFRTQGDRTVASLLGEMKTKDLSEALVFSGNRFRGVLSYFFLLTSRQSAQKAKVEHFIVPSSSVRADDDLIKVANNFLDSNSHAIIVYDGDVVKKVVDVYDLIGLLKDDEKLIKDINQVVDDVFTIEEDVTLGEALHVMHSGKYKEIFVKDENDEFTGTLSGMDILKTYTLYHTTERQHGEIPDTPANTHQTEIIDLKELSIKNFMKRSLPKIRVDAQLSGVAEAFSKNKRSILLVEDSFNDVVGQISVEHFLRHILSLYFEGVENIFFQGLDNFDDDVVENIHEITRGYAERLQHHFNNIFDMKVHIKQFHKEGSKSRYEVFARLTYPGATISSVSDDWEIITALRKSLEKLENQLIHKYKDNYSFHHEYDYDVAGSSDFEVLAGHDDK
jgi:CBS domain-containing protein/ribosome-associated translation inhibitor RaiA